MVGLSDRIRSGKFLPIKVRYWARVYCCLSALTDLVPALFLFMHLCGGHCRNQRCLGTWYLAG